MARRKTAARKHCFAPEICHDHVYSMTRRLLAYDPTREFNAWRRQVSAKLKELIGLMPDPVPLNICVEFEEERDLFRETRFIFTSEECADVPCHLLVPKSGRPPYPVLIALQGHSPGMRISLGRAENDHDKELIAGQRDFCIQAVRQGYAALAIEQRCFGERADARHEDARFLRSSCSHAAMAALLLGRTMIGERVWDVSRAIDALDTFAEVDTSRVGCFGNSGGGTITYFAACLDPRIRIAMPSCYVCTFWDSIGSLDHCECNYIPGILQYFDMGDLAALIAPRPLIIVAGREDNIFPIEATQKTFETIRRIYEAAGAPTKCRLVIGDGGHRFYADQAWPVFNELAGWVG